MGLTSIALAMVSANGVDHRRGGRTDVAVELRSVMARGSREGWERGVISLLLSGARGESVAGDEGLG